MFTNIRPTDDGLEDDGNLHNFVRNALPEHVLEIMDPLIRLEHDRNSKIRDSMVSILTTGVGCSRTIPKDRVLLEDVVNELCKVRDFHQGSS